MARQDRLLVFAVIITISTLFLATTGDINSGAQATGSSSTAESRELTGSGCKSCSVKGQLYDGHSRFQFDESCSRYRCVCRCDGTWECPARYVIDLCIETTLANAQRKQESGSSRPSTSSSSGSLPSSSPSRSDNTRCAPCVVHDKEYPGHSWFSYVHGCVTINNCICYCNGSWACPQEVTSRACADDNSEASREVKEKAKSTVKPGRDPDSTRNVNINSYTSTIPQGEIKDGHITRDTKTILTECQSCTVANKTIKGNNYFEFVEGCLKRSYCTCHCNGTWSCPRRFVENICEPDHHPGTRDLPVGCRSCEVKNSTFPGNQFFQVTDGCIEYKHCICYCDGTWNCPKAEAINKCSREEYQGPDTLSNPSCKQCEVQGQVFPGNQYFQFTDSCIEYRNCICRCDGSWSCPENNRRNVCLDRGSQAVAAHHPCGGCEVYGSKYPGNNYFQFKQDCLEYSNCVCYCNGSWSCPSDSARNVCGKEATAHLGLSDDGAGNTSATRCYNCLAYDKYFKGGDYFDVTHGCMSYRKCICRCDGSWDCNIRFAVNTCNHDNETNKHDADKDKSANFTSEKREDNQCSFCDARDKVITGNSYFNLTDGCVEYKNCLCRCDGSWECPPHFARNICPEYNQTSNSRTSSLMTCSSCVAKGKIVTGDSDFQLVDGCTLYPACRCHCNGRWECSEQGTLDVCSQNRMVDAEACSMCQSNDGVVHPPNSRFRLTEECVEHTCLCFCNGSWSCPEHENRWVCQDKCLTCNVDGQIIENNAQFVHKVGCLEYTCRCHCNGTWSCHDNEIRDTCRAVSTHGDGCKKCSVSASVVYDGESDFVLDQGCVYYKCRCNCDGSYLCPGKRARNVCRGEVLGGCRSCVVSATEIFKGNTNFAMRKGCVYYDCRCNCDGSWSCAAERARNVCLGEVPGGCRVCRVSESQTYRPGSIFDMRQGCINYKCRCNCDGGWFCHGKDARDVCKGEVPGGCRSCVISESEFYRGLSSFKLVKDCVRYQCRCKCDGSYTCPGETATRICGNSPTSVKPKCKSCRVSDVEEFDGETTFQIQRNCSRYACDCKCDGSWECPTEKTRNVCSDNSRPDDSSTVCRTCRMSRYVFPGSSLFKFNTGCFQFDCACECSGRWSCDSKNPVNICLELKKEVSEISLRLDTSAGRKVSDITASSSLNVTVQTDKSGTTLSEPDIHVQVPSPRDALVDSVDKIASRENVTTRTCRPCYADGRRFTFEDEFSIDRGCVEYKNCVCFCNGRWQCADVLDKCVGDHTSTKSPNEGGHIKTEKQSVDFTKRLSKGSSVSESKGDLDWESKTAEDTDVFVADQGIVSDQDALIARKFVDFFDTRDREGSRKQKMESIICQGCEVKGVVYLAGSKFTLQDGCFQRDCECYCKKGLSCDNFVNSCKVKASDTVQGLCKECQIGSDVFIPEKDFQINNGCLQHNCHCFCNGTYLCPAKSVRDTCPTLGSASKSDITIEDRHRGGQTQELHLTNENGDVILPGNVPGCKDCNLSGQKIQTLSTFVKQLGCYKTICFCQCNGQPSCAASSSFNLCKMADRKSGQGKKGCQVGARTHLTQVFAHVENCIQRACVCHDNGQWYCKRTLNDRKVC